MPTLESSVQRKWNILLFFVVVSIISFSPMLNAGTTYWDVSPDWIFYSGTVLNSGPVTFTAPFTTTSIVLDGSLIIFSNFNMGANWGEIGFKAPANASMLVSYVGSSTVHLVAQPTGGLKTFEIYAPNKGIPTNVSGGNSWSYSSINDIVSVNANVTENVAVTWTSTSVGSASISLLFMFIGFMGLVVALASIRRR